MAKKKELIPTTESKHDQLVGRLRKNSERSVCTASDLMKTWRYIDLINPKEDLPCLSLEWLFGCRGLLAGRILQLRATYSKGKSSFMMLVYGAAQKIADAFCYHVETEGAAAPPDYIESFGCEPEKLIIDEIDSLEECLEQLDVTVAEIRGGFGGTTSAATGRKVKSKFTDPLDPNLESPIVMGIDSLSSLGLEGRVEEDVADMTKTSALASHSRKIREYFRDRVARFKKTQALLMLTSHETAKIATGGMGGGGPQKSSLAQEAIAIHATYALDLRSKAYRDKDKGEQLGDIVTLKTTKNKLAPKNRELDMYLVWNQGFDLIKTDAEFLISHGSSPFTKQECYRHSHGITCKPLSDKSFKTDEEFIRALYADKELLNAIREKMRIRGYGFGFEARYTPSLDEIEDNADSEESDLPDGVEGSPETVPEA